MKQPKFKVGEKVKFKNITNKIPDFYCEEDFDESYHKYIRHGSTHLHRDYYKEYGTVIVLIDEYGIVRYKDVNEKYVQLGFLLKDLISLKITDWEKEIGD